VTPATAELVTGIGSVLASVGVTTLIHTIRSATERGATRQRLSQLEKEMADLKVNDGKIGALEATMQAVLQQLAKIEGMFVLRLRE
jgi:hypothetical protein